ncbi:reverse transcriptase [Plakobranchus ocellatus]|uniref:Reverse transcriptase n=1 Tax=Plakobranchus ocellatus TaxID=259542 RepID=A0AAV3ZHM4_9GAST|nr:reverse transcriptase [Plakobranchus ocellatus]
MPALGINVQLRRISSRTPLRSTPIAILELATGCEPFGLRRGEQTVFVQERYLRTGEGVPLRTMVENFFTRHRRIKKVSVLSVAHDLSKTYGVPTDRAPLPVPPWAPETPPPLPVTSLHIGPMGRKEETCPLAMRALSLETIARFGRENAIAYMDGSSTGGTGNGGYGIYFLWPDGSTTRKCGPVGEWTCSYEFELMAVTECLRIVIGKQREGAALPGVVILTDCRALALGGSGSECVGEAVLLADYLLKTEGVQTMVQGIASHIGVPGNEIADGLANEGRSMPQPRKPLTLSDARSVLQHGTARLWGAAQLSRDERFPRFYEACKARDYLQCLPRSDAVQIFRTRAKHTLLLADRARHGWSATTACRLCGEREETITHVLSECREIAGDRLSGWSARPMNEILWCCDRVAMSTAAKIMRKFLRRAMR